MNPDEETSQTAKTELEGSAEVPGDAGSLAPGTRLGAYRIRRTLGEGGMGQVYLAEQTAPVHRDVALKLIRQQMASPLALAWFEVERQALAQMQHPAIAQIFDAGTTPDGHAFFAMEYVEGVPLTEYCRKKELSLDQRIALFVRTCQGVQHAHQKGVIHRDLKPDNVLVQDIDGAPMPKIIDFGIAVGGSTTESGPVVARSSSDRAGTAIYMSPEQAGARHRDIDTRSDVYSLGVMLCEILTHSDARSLTSNAHHSTHAPQQTLLTALGSTPEATRAASSTNALLTAARMLPAELRAVLRKALAQDRADRYESATALAEDLERFRDNRPVLAMPASRAYAARKFVARHRLGIVATGFAALALILGTIMAVQGLRRAEAAAAQARIEADKAAQVAAFVQEMIAGIDPDRAKGLDRSLMRLMLDSAAARASTELEGQPEVHAVIENTIAQSYASLGEYALAQEHFAESVKAGKAASLAPAEIARTQARAAENLFNLGQREGALATVQQAYSLVSDLPAEDRDRLRIESILADMEGSVGNAETARVRLQEILALQRRLFGNDSEDVQSTIDSLAALNIDTAHFDEARPLLEEVLASRLEKYGRENSKTYRAINGLAIIALEQKRHADAEKLLAPQLPVAERVFGMEHPVTQRLVSNLGGAIRQQDRNEEARPYYERAAALAQKLYGPNNIATIVAESNLSLLLRDSGDLAGAEAHGRTATAAADVALATSPMRGIIHRELASVLIRQGKYVQAQAELDDAWETLSQGEGYGPEHPRSQDVVDSYIELYAAWPKPQREAEWRSLKSARED
ncbi:protein kinase domain-containing protein [Dokdonella sp.]|uniref:serine/threonine-protein kinase n=1 Tax=Dokdonella sp. TaxID=2291710 RepID=UPI003C3E37AE